MGVTLIADVAFESPQRVVGGSIPTKAAAVFSPTGATAGRDSAPDYLRAFVTVLVVAVHSAAGYALVIPASHPHHAWLAGAPVADSHRLPGVDLFLHFNDNFFMSLMFFLSGLFVWPSLARKGSGIFVRDRLLRLGVPFACAALLIPLAYYAPYRLHATDPGFAAYCREWLSLGFWPSGPLWFVALLLAFDVLAAALDRIAPRLFGSREGIASAARGRPAMFFARLVILSAAAYLPMQLAFGADSWVKAGPFFLQTSRLLHYGVYFFAGVAVGAVGIDRGLVARDGLLARHWPVWVTVAVLMFLVDVLRMIVFLPVAADYGVSPLARHLLSGLVFVACCAATSFAMLALFLRFANARTPVLDSLARNAYGVYLVHFGFVLWLQYALLPFELPAAAKVAVVFPGALLASWIAIAALRRISVVSRAI